MHPPLEFSTVVPLRLGQQSMARLGVLMTRIFLVLAVCLTVFFPLNAGAQQSVWVQVEAQPTQAQAEDRARIYANRIDGVAGFKLPGRWHAIVIGPFDASVAPGELNRLKLSGQVPSDAYIVDGRSFQEQFWPAAGAITVQPLEPATEGATEVAAAPLEPIPAEETPAQARASERALTRDDRRLLQTALQWEGFYNSTIDGLFGPGTRRSMAAYQTAKGFEPTGILSTNQRAELLAAYQAVIDSIGLQVYWDREAGIEIEIPTALVTFTRYDAPFARFDPTDANGPQVLLISQAGDADTLNGLYNVLQTLEIMPVDGPRTLRRRSFAIEGRSSKITSFAFAELVDETVKGFILVWPAEDDKRRQLTLTRMRETYAALPDVVLPDSAGVDVSAQRTDMLSGLTIRVPEISRSGFFVSSDGAVVTTTEVLENCERITLNDEARANVIAADRAKGLALLRPEEPLAPIAVAHLSTALPRIQSEIALAGFSYEGALGAATVTYGTLEDMRGLNGETGQTRLAVLAQPGDAGGPVMDLSGSVLGMLLPDPGGQRALPPEVGLSITTADINAFLSENQVETPAQPVDPVADPLDLTIRAADMTVLVSCWTS